MSEYDSYVLPLISALISGVAIAVVTQVVAHHYSEKSLKAQQENALKIARMQLYHEDRKDALVKLDELLKTNYKTFHDFQTTITLFLDGSVGLFIPKKLRGELKKEMFDISAFLSVKEAEMYGEPNDSDQGEYMDWLEALSPEEQLDLELKDRLSRLKGKMRNKIKEHVSED